MGSLTDILFVLWLIVCVEAELIKRYVVRMENLVETNKQLNDVVTTQKDMMSKLDVSIEGLLATVEAQGQTIRTLNLSVVAQESAIAAQGQTIQELDSTVSVMDGKLL